MWQRVYVRRAAILVKKDIPFKTIPVDSDSVVAMEIGGVLVIACYLSPKVDPDRDLTVVHNLLCRSHKMVLAGDFNCRTVGLYAGRLRGRDSAFEQLIHDHGLTVANSNEPTLDYQGHLSINDYTLYKEIAVTNWQVLKDCNTLSDHFYIAFNAPLRLPAKRIF